ncbi:MAG TPA: flagellar hook-associated protein FlgK [Bacilli bacterium]
MRSTFHGIEVAKRSLFTQQAALQTTGHNIANANTRGYSRQVVNMVASRPIEAVGMSRSNVPGQLGMGVEFSSITRVRERFLDDQFHNENKSLGSWSVQSDTLEKLETIVNEPSDTGLRSVIDNFWKSWSDLSNDPLSVTGRKIVRENAIALADAFNLTSKQLSDLHSDLTNSLNVKATQISSIASTIANLNSEIQRIEGLGDNANDLRDQRDVLTDDLSKIVNIQVVETQQGYTITMGGTTLVAGGAATNIAASTLESAFSSGDLNSGEAYGIIVSRDRYVADYQKQLDILANTIATGEVQITIPAGSVLPDNTVLQVVQPDGSVQAITFTGANRTLTSDTTVVVNGLNGLHKLGYTFKDPLTPGEDFFTAKTGTDITAATIQLNPAIAADSSMVASSMRTIVTGTTEEVVKGNNTLALLVSQLRETKFEYDLNTSGVSMDQGTIDDFYRSMVGQLGVQTSEANRQLSNQKALVDQVDSRRQSVSGVSLDEEMANLIKFQHAYAAAARMMTTFDQLLDKVINGMGIVGR